MSTHLQTPNDIQNIAETKSLSLAELVSELQSQKSIPSRARINDWLENAVLSDEDLAPYVGFKEGNYWRIITRGLVLQPFDLVVVENCFPKSALMNAD